MTALTPVPSKLLKVMGGFARVALWVMLAAWFLFGAIWGALHLVIVPRIGDLRPQLEAQASRALGVPVTMGGIVAKSTGLIPSFELTDVKLFDAQGRAALTLPRVLVAMSPKSALGFGFEQLYIDRPELNIRRTKDGKLEVAGLDFSKGGGSDGSVADWFFSQAEFVIRNGTVQWTDELRAMPPLALTQVDLVIRNRFRSHSVRIDATPPADLGDRFTTMAMFKQPLLSRRNGQWTDWDGQLYGGFARVDVARLKGYADLGLDVAQGFGALHAWVDISQGAVMAATADVALTEVNATLGARLVPLELQSVAGRLGGRFLPGGFEFSTEGLQFQTRDGLRWPGGNVRMLQLGADGKQSARGELVADKLDLAALSEIAGRLPLGDAIHTRLTAIAPTGQVETLKASWQGSVEAPEKFEAKGRVVHFAVATKPGFRGVSVDFNVDQSGGSATLNMENGAFDLPGVFDEPVVPFDQVSADVKWQLSGDKIAVQIPNLKFSNADAQGEAKVVWHSSEPTAARGDSRFPGVVDLEGSMSRLQGTRVHRYLPSLMHLQVRHYVRDAVQKGTASGLKFKVKGDLYDMPFADAKQGEFKISTNMSDVTFAYVPRSLMAPDTLPWPEITQVSGELLIDRLMLQVKVASGKLAGPAGQPLTAGLQITKAEGSIPDLMNSTTVNVTAEARGALSNALGIVNGSPLGRMVGNVLKQSTATGNADLRLKMTLPLGALEKSTVQGSVTLANSDVTISPVAPGLTRARGVLSFSESGFTVSNVQARMLGGDIRLEGGSVATGSASPSVPALSAFTLPTIALRAQGTVTADGLRQAKELGFVSRIAQQASGGAAYTATLGIRKGVPEFLVSSNLVGLALNLPAPLRKTADSALPLRFETALLPTSPQGKLLDQLHLEVGRIASVTYVRDVSGADARVLRGGIATGLAADESAPVPDEGVVANINMAAVDLDAWAAVLSQAAGERLTGDVPDTGVTSATSASPATASMAQSYLPTSLAIRARELTLGGRKLNNVVVGGSRDGLTWRANVSAAELNGYAEYRQGSGSNAGRVFARLARLTLASDSAKDVENFLDEQPASIPALDIVVDDFELRGKRLGRVEIEAINRGAGGNAGGAASVAVAREWRLNKFNVTMPEAVFTASGNWASVNAQAPAANVPRGLTERRRTVMNFKLDVADAGELLTRFGMKDVVRKGKGKLQGQVAWAGSPFSPDYPTLGGSFTVGFETGQFLKADPGLAKLLGVLSLQSLPRRLALDFRDVFSEGFTFDFVRGDVMIEQGIARTNNLQMKGVNAAVLMDGRADIAKETQDMRVIVVPEINAGTASLIATAINPAIGLGTFLAQVLLRGALIESATQEFHVDGTWVDPRVTKVPHKPATTPDSKPEVQK
jgi:uncharacterized protein (TIGR02099 family)